MCSRRGQATMKSKRSQAAAGLGAEKAERCGDSKENPIVIMESPLTRLNPSKLLSTPAGPPPSASTGLPSQGKRRKLCHDFQLYSHATDPDKCFESVCALDEEMESCPHTPNIPHTSSTISPLSADANQIESKPFNKFSQGALETLADSGLSNCIDRAVCFVQLLEQLLAHGYYIPAKRIPLIVDTILAMSDKHLLFRLHSLLCQDIVLCNKDLPSLIHHFLLDTLHTLCDTLLHTPIHLPSRIILHYISHLNPPLSSSLTHKLLDVAFSTLTLDMPDCLPCPTDIIFVWLTHNNIEWLELAARIERLSNTVEKCSVLRCIPQLDCRLRVIQLILSIGFQGKHYSQTLPLTASLEELCTAHFTQRPYRPNGTPRNLSYFLSLLLLLLETWLLINDSHVINMQCVRIAVDQLTDTLSQDPVFTNEVCSPQAWLQLQLLKSFGQ